MARFVIIGMGKFGTAVASTLNSHDAEVIGIDKDELVLEEVKDRVTSALCLDATDDDLANMNWGDKFHKFEIFLKNNLDANMKDFIDDCLQWDWILHSRKNNTPTWLDNSLSLDMKNEVFNDLKGEGKEYWKKLLGRDVGLLKKCAFFVAKSNCFKQLYKGASKAIIFTDKIIEL